MRVAGPEGGDRGAGAEQGAWAGDGASVPEI